MPGCEHRIPRTRKAKHHRKGLMAEGQQPALVSYLEYSSTISASLMSAPNWSRSGSDLNTPENLVASTWTHAGSPTDSASLSASCTRSCFLALSRSDTVSPVLTWYDEMSTTLSLTITPWCETSWRASARVEPKPMR